MPRQLVVVFGPVSHSLVSWATGNVLGPSRTHWFLGDGQRLWTCLTLIGFLGDGQRLGTRLALIGFLGDGQRLWTCLTLIGFLGDGQRLGSRLACWSRWLQVTSWDLSRTRGLMSVAPKRKVRCYHRHVEKFLISSPLVR